MNLKMFPLPERDYVNTGKVRLAPASYASQYRMLALILLLLLINLLTSVVVLVYSAAGVC